MTKPSFVQVFGTGTARLASGATTTTTGLFIPDSALVAGGLTTPSTADAEAHLTAILLAAQSYLTDANFTANTDQSLVIANGFSSFTTRGTTQYRQDQLTISLAEPDTSSTINPNNY